MKSVKQEEIEVGTKAREVSDTDSTQSSTVTNDATEDEAEEEEEDSAHLNSVSQLQRESITIPDSNEENIEYYGALGDNDSNVNNPKARKQVEKLKDTYNEKVPEHQRDQTLPWPSVSDEPENEFTGTRIFVNMFPWLFPGGIGDINETGRTAKTLHFKTWANYLLHYGDGRFAKDRIWCFYTENMRQRRENMSSGSFFINNFVKANVPESIEELQEKIQAGDLSFIDKLQYQKV